MGYIQGEGRQQSSLFPPTLEELVPEDYLVRVNDRPGRRSIVTLHSWPPQPNDRPGRRSIVTLHSWPPQPNDRPGRRPIVTLHSWQPGRLTPTHILLAGLTAQALAGQSRLYRI